MVMLLSELSTILHSFCTKNEHKRTILHEHILLTRVVDKIWKGTQPPFYFQSYNVPVKKGRNFLLFFQSQFFSSFSRVLP